MKSRSTVLWVVFMSVGLLAAGCTSEYVGGTTVTPHMEEKITPGRSLLYCSTFQIVWNERRGMQEEGSERRGMQAEGSEPADEPPVVMFLNKGLSTREDISEDCYVAMFGKGKNDIVGKINSALREKFGKEAPVVKEQLDLEDTMAYAYLYKNLKFEKEFEGLEAPIAFHSSGGTNRVKGFGIQKYSSGKHRELGRQVEVLAYKDDSEFVIRLKSVRPNDEIVLAKVKPRDTLLATIEAVQKRAGGRRAWQLSKGDTLQIPRFDFDITRSYDELLKIYYLWKKAEQKIRFRLDERGAVLKSEARIVVQPEESGRVEPKHLIFDRPFLIYLKEKGARYPYFALWVDSADLMVRE